MEARRGASGQWPVAEPCLRPGGLTFSSPFILLEGHSADTDLDLKAFQDLPLALRRGCRGNRVSKERGGRPFPRDHPNRTLSPPEASRQQEPHEAGPGLGSVSWSGTCRVLPGPSKGNVASPHQPSVLTQYPQPLAPAANWDSPDTAFTSPIPSAPTSPDSSTPSRTPTCVSPQSAQP